MIAEDDLELLAKLGINVTDMEYDYPEPNAYDGSYATIPVGNARLSGTFEIDEDQFRPMCHLIRLVDMVCESKNPAVNEMFNHLVTMLELTKES